MQGSWVQIVITGTVVGLAFSLGPMIAEFYALVRLVRYVNLDIVHFQQLLASGDEGNLVFPLSRKLSETGILLAWKTQRDLKKLSERCAADGAPLQDDIYPTLVASLETYRATAGMLADRVGGLVWHAGVEFNGPIPPFVTTTFAAIDRNWAEFARYSAWLEKFAKKYSGVPTEKV